MRELTADMFVSLDGFAAAAKGGQGPFLGYAGPEFQSYVRSVLDEPQLMIMGRVTYKLLSTYWPSATGHEAGRMNSLPKLVFSKTLKEPLSWNARLAKGDLADEILALKRQSGDPIRSIGSLKLVQSMMKLGLIDMCGPALFAELTAQGLIDKYMLYVCPSAVGQGTHLFREIPENIKLNFERTVPFATGVSLHYYTPVYP